VHVVAIRLRIRPHEAVGIDQRLLALGQLRNAVVRDARKRAQAMKGDTRWCTNMKIVDPKERALAYKKLCREYDVGEFACAHWQRSQWMANLIDRRAHQRRAIFSESSSTTDRCDMRKRFKSFTSDRELLGPIERMRALVYCTVCRNQPEVGWFIQPDGSKKMCSNCNGTGIVS